MGGPEGKSTGGLDELVSGGRCGKHFQVSGLGRQVPGSGVQHQVQVRDLYPHPHPKTRT